MGRMRRAWQFLSWERAVALSLALGAFVPAMAFGAVETIRGSYLSAVEETVRGDAGGASYQFTDSRQPSPISSSLDRRPDVTPVWGSMALLTSHGGRAAVHVSLTSTPRAQAQPRFGSVVSGRAARQGEIVLAQATADELTVGPGDPIAVMSGTAKPEMLRVSGVVVAPQRPDDFSAFCLCAAARAGEPARWLTTADPFTDPLMRDAAMDRFLQVRVTDSTVADARAEANENALAWLRWAPPALSIVAIVVAVALATSMRTRFLTTVDGLEAAGAGPLGAWAIPTMSIGLATLAGSAGGLAAGVGVTRVFMRIVGDLSGQLWLGVTMPWLASGRYALVVTVAVASGAFAVLSLPRFLALRLEPQPKQLVLSGILGAGLGTLLVLSPRTGAYRDPRITLGGGLVLSVGLFLVVAAAIRAIRGSVRNRVASVGRSAMFAVSISVCAGVCVGTWFAAYLGAVGIQAGEVARMQPPGSVVVAQVREDVARAIAGERPASPALVMTHFDESQSMLRVTSPPFGECVARQTGGLLEIVQNECPLGESLMPVNVTASVPVEGQSADVIRADPLLIHDGSVSLMRIGAGGRILSVTDAPAIPDARLTGLLPGAVLPSGGSTVRDLGLKPAGTATLLLEHFSTLEPRERAAIRASIAQRAGYATMSEDRPTTREPSAVLAVFVGAAAGMVLAALVAAVGSALCTSQARLRRLFIELGLEAGDRRRVGWSNLWILPLAGLIGAAVAILSAGALRRPLHLDPVVLALPTLGVIASTALSVFRYGRVPGTRAHART